MINIVMYGNCSLLIHNCDQCLYQTIKKYNLYRHQYAKHNNTFIENNDFMKSRENVHPNIKNVHPNEKNVHPNEKNVHSRLICTKCNKIYKTKKCLILHENNCNGIDDLTCPRCMISFSSRQAKSNHIKRNNCSPKSIIHARQPNPQNIEKEIVVNNNKIETQINNNTNIEKIINTTNNIYINNYGNERLDYLNYEKLISILTTGYDVPRLLTKEIHFNKEFPENNNIHYKNDSNALIKKDDEFILKDLNILAEELVKEKTSQMQKFAEENKEEICLKIENQKYQDIVELLLQFILLKEPQEHYKKQITKIKDIIKNNK
jgi:hypothetical protein|tara:strand:+ start:453 stop:1409 length:957 start_codon:yes stop_codon:yes gene_type:complete